ncbi:hypothetical protein N6H18_12360 [Reichenbachiella agarivorans]|uniref:Uncharacterized protein n=1 Tax=Reichenbachiella agarivorans TaxID=2979464 RepID=A0ABY6CKV4_9BACT|nr:hypothetical protein [Reichenbachiella agarivorans]UXP31141.1 hypothetical protein N6H18_12360 [Reichenbachiella agarivorans]
MELTTITGLVVIALCVMIFVIIHKSRVNKERELVNGLKAIALSCNSDIQEVECGLEFAIGMSDVKDYVFFYKKRQDYTNEQYVPLSAVGKCYVQSVRRPHPAKGSTEVIIDKLDLILEFKDKKLGQRRFEFYNSDERLQMNGEMQLIQNWESIINNCLKK